MRKYKNNILFRLTALCVIMSFGSTFIAPLPQVYAQSSLDLPSAGAMVHLSPAYVPPTLKGIIVHPKSPFQFDFILDSGDADMEEAKTKAESEKLVKYFLTALTLPEDDLWVNLSPYEADRIIPDEFGRTEMGQVLLEQDYLLKQLTASLMNPKEELGEEFWEKVYKEAYAKYGVTDIPVNTFNKVWIVPSKALVYENVDRAFVVESHLKVMLEEDYYAMKMENGGKNPKNKNSSIDSLASNFIKEIILPVIEDEVNHGQHFAKLRQVYHSFILASWYKENLKASVLNQAYSDQKKIGGLEFGDEDSKDKIYNQYLDAFKTGVYDLIKEEYDTSSQKIIPRRYFSGGVKIQYDSTETNEITLPVFRNNNLSMISIAVAQIFKNDSAMLEKENNILPEWIKKLKKSEDIINHGLDVLKRRYDFDQYIQLIRTFKDFKNRGSLVGLDNFQIEENFRTIMSAIAYDSRFYNAEFSETKGFLEKNFDGHTMINKFNDSGNGEELLNAVSQSYWEVFDMFDRGTQIFLFKSFDYPDLVIKIIPRRDHPNLILGARRNQSENEIINDVRTGYYEAKVGVLRGRAPEPFLFELDENQMSNLPNNLRDTISKQAPFLIIQRRHRRVRKINYEAYFYLYRELLKEGYIFQDIYAPKQLGYQSRNPKRYVLLDNGNLLKVQKNVLKKGYLREFLNIYAQDEEERIRQGHISNPEHFEHLKKVDKFLDDLEKEGLILPDNSMLTKRRLNDESVSSKKGGIDLNQDYLDLKTQGQSVDMSMFTDGMKNIHIENGLVPVINSITPVMNLQLLFGRSQGQEEPLPNVSFIDQYRNKYFLRLEQFQFEV